MRTEPNSILRLGTRHEYALVNNQHGIARLAAGDSYRQGIFLSPDNAVPGWTWNCRTEQPNVKGAPQIMFGVNPYSNVRTTSLLPIALDKISVLKAAMRVDLGADGKMNLAFDLWVVKTAQPPYQGEASIRAEIMVWLDNLGMVDPNWHKAGTMQLFGKTVQAYREMWHQFPTFIFDASGIGSPGAVFPLDSILRFVQATGEFGGGEAYLASVQLMNEVVSGQGLCFVDNFEVILKPVGE